MNTSVYFSFEKDWRAVPLAYWVHVPVPGLEDSYDPPVPQAVPHRGYVVLHVEFERHDLVFSAPAQLDHFIEVLATTPLPTSRQLSARRGPSVGPNGHWLSRLPAALKSPRTREKLVQALRTIRAQVVTSGPGDSFRFDDEA